MPFVVGGLIGGLATFGILLAIKKSELDERAKTLEAGIRGQGSGTQMLLELQGQTMQNELRHLAEQTAQVTAQQVMLRVYGLTPAVVAAFSRVERKIRSLPL